MEEAKQLIVLCCPRNINGEYIARELAEEQTLENLKKFADVLDSRHRVLIDNGFCECKEK